MATLGRAGLRGGGAIHYGVGRFTLRIGRKNSEKAKIALKGQKWPKFQFDPLCSMLHRFWDFAPAYPVRINAPSIFTLVVLAGKAGAEISGSPGGPGWSWLATAVVKFLATVRF